MTGNPNEVRDLMPSLNRGGFPASAWLSNTPPACLDEEASIDKSGCNPDGCSIASDDQLLEKTRCLRPPRLVVRRTR